MFYHFKSRVYFEPLDIGPRLFYAIYRNFPEMLNDRQRHPLACPMHSSPQSVYFYNALNFMHFEEVL